MSYRHKLNATWENPNLKKWSESKELNYKTVGYMEQFFEVPIESLENA